jgi:hypothetical protein
MTAALDTLVPFSVACKTLGLSTRTAERYWRTRPHIMPKVYRAGWERFVDRGELERYAAKRPLAVSQLQTLATAVAWATTGQRSRG